MDNEETLSPPMQPGVDHQKQIEATRSEIAQAAGVPVADVTPKAEVAENNLNRFLEGVAQTKAEQGAPIVSEKPSALDDFREEVESFIGEETDRMMPTDEAGSLKAEREQKMESQKTA